MEPILKIAIPQIAEVMTYEKNLIATEVLVMRIGWQNPLNPRLAFISSIGLWICSTQMTSFWKNSRREIRTFEGQVLC